ncbi:hypothetical protein BOS5A_211376 [Bosea sp. EC-HK365B]|nr:hypothetical protein BOSE21B_50314 [Bosea sp. 21B]CAD5288849.1 hypothetical protein BOSE46_70302 [Bosea sp. 46]CAD5301315.1 hypothetical protein BOSE7B_90375 [Bosea sp. 7B]VVT60585.1 hypothetical protein BOS5A_211376 [Bosea sp. EC-HK365B]VXC59909.1 hypothetical protein BOSE29B_50303 [Bosea sp. 29B]VXC92265.1 hypothetical protein BOSE125_70366 [Bosea sp. 125]
MPDPIGESHQPRKDEGDRPAQEADGEQGAADDFEDGGIPGQCEGGRHAPGWRLRKAEQLLGAVRQQGQRRDDAQQCERMGRVAIQGVESLHGRVAFRPVSNWTNLLSDWVCWRRSLPHRLALVPMQRRSIKSRFRLQCSKITERQIRNSGGFVHHCGNFAEIGLNHPLKAPCLNPVWKMPSCGSQHGGGA